MQSKLSESKQCKQHTLKVMSIFLLKLLTPL